MRIISSLGFGASYIRDFTVTVLTWNPSVLMCVDYHWCPQTLEEIYRNMAICCSFRAEAAREKYPGFITLRPRQNARHFADDIFKWIFLNENVWFPIKISLKFVLKGLINNILALVQIMAWRQPGDKPLSEPMMVSLMMHICVTRPQWVKYDLLNSRHNYESCTNKGPKFVMTSQTQGTTVMNKRPCYSSNSSCSL